MARYKIQDIKKTSRTGPEREPVKKKALPVQEKIEIEKPERKKPFIRPSDNEAVVAMSSAHEEVPELYLKERRPVRIKNNSGKSRMIGFGVLILLILLTSGYFIANAFAHTTITLKNKTQSFTFDHKPFTASKDQDAAVPFEIMIVSDTQTKDMVLTESQSVSTKAKGTIMLYNEYSTKAQNISVGTYVSDENGKVYKTDKTVSIPGYTLSKGVIVPGKVSVSVTAFLAGSGYNGNPVNLTINAFKGTTKFKKIYAKATTAMTGGAQGSGYALSAAQKGEVDAAVNSSFKSSLFKKAYAQVPPGYILYPDAMKFLSQTDTTTLYESKNAKVSLSGTVSALLLKETDISRAIVKSSLPALDAAQLEGIQVPELEKFSFTFANQGQLVTKDIQSVPFTLTGDVTVVWHPDIEALRAKLVGVPTSAITQVFKEDPGIDTARITVFPPWQSNVPTDVSKIRIHVE